MERNVLKADDGREIPMANWRPAAERAPRAWIQLLHGLGEHAGRYERFAEACNGQDIGVTAHDHRGHGAFATTRGHFADANGWHKVIGDAHTVKQSLLAQHADVPLVVFGHSMGSFIAQDLVMRHPDGIALLVLSGSTFSSRSELRAAHLLAGLMSLIGKQSKSPLLNKLGFSAFNKPFEPARTELDWLSRDEQAVDRYIADPLCGGGFSNKLWHDLTGGLLRISSVGAIASIPDELPVLIFGGQDDPVGGEKGMSRLAQAYRRTGHDVTLKVYPGGRHEMLNEINRDEVTRHVLLWITAYL